MLKEKHDQWVLETVDCLRQRKARPDLQRISRMVERFHGLTFNETKESLERLTEIGIVMKVYFKGNISYRHVKNTNKGTESKVGPNNQVYNTSVRITQAIRSIVKQTGDGASLSDLEAWLIAKNPDTRLVKHRLQTALKRELDAENIVQLSDKTYILKDDLPVSKFVSKDKPPMLKKVENVNQPEVSKKSEVVEPTTSSASMTVIASTSNDDVMKESDDHPKRGRPLSKRKKFKKTHGPDFENPLQIKKTYNKDGEKNGVPVCGYCSHTAEKNSHGNMEPLLTCKDCDAKAHPSCMDYSEDLARRALDSPWQCMDCKTCFMCDGSENAVSELMLFCDACDKGYHMTCHDPPLMSKPKGKWICGLCQDEDKKSNESSDKVNKSYSKKGPLTLDRLSEGSYEEDDDMNKKGKKRKLSLQKSLPLPKRVKTSPMSDEPSNRVSHSQPFDTYTDGTAGASCLPTPSASPRPSDTFDYELKMSQLGFPVYLKEDNTIYSDATDWKTDDVVKFFEDCGFKDHAQAFKEQEIDGRSLLLMQRNDVLTGLGLKLGPALKIYHKVVKLQIFSQVSSL